MNLFRSSRLNQKGFSLHFVLPMLVVALVAFFGYRILFASHADTPANLTFNSNNIIYTSDGATAPSSIANITVGTSSSDIASTYYNNGQNIAYIENAADVYTYNPATKTSALLAKLPVSKSGQIQTIAWSEKAQKFYALIAKLKAKKNGEINIDSLVTFNANGKGVKKVFTPGNNVYVNVGPWSPDGTKIPIYAVNFNTQNTTEGMLDISSDTIVDSPALINGNCAQNYTASWSGDSNYIYCAEGNSVEKVNVSTGVSTSVVSAPSGTSILRSSLSPNGSYLAYVTNVSTTGLGCNVYILSITGSTSKQIATEPDTDVCYALDWSPDSSKLAFSDYNLNATAPSHLYVETLSGSTLQDLFTTSKQNSTQYGAVYGVNWSVQ